jgi:hypothetical protein
MDHEALPYRNSGVRGDAALAGHPAGARGISAQCADGPAEGT